jgi:acetylglutamate kinase
VGHIVETQPALAASLLDAGVIPIISPISLGFDGHTFNVNADHAATALACAVGAAELVFVSNVSGVLISQNGDSTGETKECVEVLTAGQVNALIQSGEISGGMVPKVHSALTALENGISRVRITDLAGLCVGGGTCLLPS